MLVADPAIDEGLRELACAGFCAFHHPEKDDEEKCAAFITLRGLFRPGETGRSVAGVDERIAAAIKEATRSAAPISYGHERLLEALVCGDCPFLDEGGCNHRNPAMPPEERLEPCGGYAVLVTLIEAGGLG